MYKMVSKVTKDATALVSGNMLGGHLCPIYFALDLCYSKADLVLVGQSYKEFANLAVQV